MPATRVNHGPSCAAGPFGVASTQVEWAHHPRSHIRYRHRRCDGARPALWPIRTGAVKHEAGTAGDETSSRRSVLQGVVTAVTATVTQTLRPDASHAYVIQESVLAEEAATPLASSTVLNVSGINALRDPAINRGLSTPMGERALLSLEGLLPPGEASLQMEVERARMGIERSCSPLSKYQAISVLMETDERCCYALLQQYTEEYLPIIYTPTVGEACMSWGSLLPRPTGLYISMKHYNEGRVQEVVDTWPQSEIQIAVITDGERILGLGDLGAHGMGIPVGKVMVYGACGISPSSVLPVLVDVGCDTDSVRDHPLYVGTRKARERGEAYYAVMETVVSAIRRRWGPRVIMHWEDVGSKHSFELLKRLGDAGVPTFNDDIQCTSAIVLAAMMAGTRLEGVPRLRDQTVLFFGAGQTNTGCASLMCAALQREGLSERQACEQIFLMDSKGLLLTDRVRSGNNARFAKNPDLFSGVDVRNLASLMATIRPTALIGASSVGGAFTQEALEAMCEGVARRVGHGGRPLVLALSNPTERAECTYAQAHQFTKGKVVYASGTQFPMLEVANGSDNRILQPAQVNNCFVFPGVGLGSVVSQAVAVDDAMLLAAADTVAGLVSEDNLHRECILPGIGQLGEVAVAVALAVAVANMAATPVARSIIASQLRSLKYEAASHA